MDLKEFKENLTNEVFSKRFKSQFEMVNYMIRLAGNMIDSGREPRVKIDSKNIAIQIAAEVALEKDQLDDIVEKRAVPEVNSYITNPRQ